MTVALTVVLLLAASALGFVVGALVARRRALRVPGPEQRLAAETLGEIPDATEHPSGPAPALANVVNLLNNRLSGITGMLALVRRESLTGAQRRTLDAATSEVRQAATVVRDLARHMLDRNDLPAVERTDLAGVLRDVIIHCKPAVAAASIELSANTDEAIPVSGSRIILIDAMNALLAFAIERLRNADGDRRIVWDAQPVGGSVIVTQTDTGPLVAPDDAAMLLDPVGGATDDEQPGRLALARQAIESLGGTITVGPAAAGGAHVTVTLWADTTARPVTRAPEPRLPDIPEFTGARILVVEDDPLNQEALAQFFEYEGHHVTVASNGVEALNRMARAEFDAVVVDLQMPVLGGRGLYEQTIERFPHMGSRFVFVTGDGARASSREFLANSGQPAVMKPFEPRELMAAVYQATQRRRNTNWH